MAHAIENMLSVGQLPWHGLGVNVQTAPTLEEGLELSGLNWRVDCVNITAGGQPLDRFGKAVQRSTDGKILGIVGPKWRPLQNSQAFAWFKPFVDSGAAELHTAGSLHGGKVVWVLARVRGSADEIRPGDKVENFVLLSNSHDGSQAVRVGFTPIRVVCANTLGAAHRDEASSLLRVRHTAGMVPTLREVRDIMDVQLSEFRATVEQYRRLAQRKINRRDLENYVRLVICKQPEKPTSQEFSKIQQVCELAINGRGNTGMSAWDAYNGVTEYLSYSSGRGADTRLDSLWFGSGTAKLREAFEFAAAI